MKAAILSAGRNRRLASLGKPKGLLKVHGQTLFERTFKALERAGFDEVFCVIRKDADVLASYLKTVRRNFKITLIKRNSRNPFYSLVAIGEYLDDEGVLVFNVDSFFAYQDLIQFSKKMRDKSYIHNKDMVMWAMSPFEGIEDPAYMKINAEGRILDYGKDLNPTPTVFAQVRYCGAAILKAARHGYKPRMKTFIQYLIHKGYSVYAYPTRSVVYDIDTPQDVVKVKQLTTYDHV